ncbi:MAG: ABC transporter permease [Actinobacteria bacterium]|nr:ABC transporter permease [Actinomycetota bacterium]
MNLKIIRILISKDLSLFFRKRAIVLLTFVGLIFYLVIYFVMPSSVDEDLKIGMYSPVSLPLFTQINEEGLEISNTESEEALKEAVLEGDYVAGISIPADLMKKLGSNQKPNLTLYFTPDAPQEIKEAIEVVVRELIYIQTGQPLVFEVSEEILGQDMTGTPLPPRDRLRPLLAIFIIMMEILGLSNLISEEVERRTARALLVTPATVTEIFIAKSIFGIGLAFVQAILIMTIIGGMNMQPLIILVSLLLGAALATGISFLISAKARDFMSVLAWSFPILIILIIPSFTVIFPGIVTGWVKIIPSYYLVDTVHRSANFGSGWGDIWVNLLILFSFTAVIFWAGIFVLRRKFR